MDLLNVAAAGMRDQRSVLDIAARNVAAAQASTPGHPYARLVAHFAPAGEEVADDSLAPDGDEGDPIGDAAMSGLTELSVHAQPGSGDALTEMIAVLDAQRAYEQNASIFDTGKRLAERTIDIGRG